LLSGGAFIVDDFVQAFDAVSGEGDAAIFAETRRRGGSRPGNGSIDISCRQPSSSPSNVGDVADGEDGADGQDQAA
jgi:hypothetical protein